MVLRLLFSLLTLTFLGSLWSSQDLVPHRGLSRHWRAEQESNKKLDQRELKDIFKQYIQEHRRDNSSIPAHAGSEGIVRIMTYNVHEQKDIDGRDSTENLYNLLKHKLNPDVAILQELCFDHQEKQDEFTRNLNDMGYTGIVYGNAPYNRYLHFFGNAIASKYPLSDTQVKTFRIDTFQCLEQRCFIRARVHASPDHSLVVYGTHLDCWDPKGAVGLEQIKEIIHDTESFKQEFASILITGDFNSQHPDDFFDKATNEDVWLQAKNDSRHPPLTQVTAALEAAGFQDSFTATQQPRPKFTCWTGRGVDGIWMNHDHYLPIERSDIYLSDASDHFPIIMDVIIPPPSNDID